MAAVTALDFDRHTVERAYDRWAPIYDLVFGAVFERGRQASLEAAERVGGRILEVGVGTGISLPDYSKANRVFGVDISEPMLRKARQRVDRARTEQRRRHRGDGRAAPRVRDRLRSTSWWRNMSSPRCPIPRRRSTNSPACSSPAAKSCCSAASARIRACGARWSICSRRSRAGSAGAPNSPGSATSAGPQRPHGMRLVERRPIPPFGHFSLIRYVKTTG